MVGIINGWGSCTDLKEGGLIIYCYPAHKQVLGIPLYAHKTTSALDAQETSMRGYATGFARGISVEPG